MKLPTYHHGLLLDSLSKQYSRGSQQANDSFGSW